MDWIAHLSAFTVFLTIATVGFVLLLVSLLFGEIFEHFEAGFADDLSHGGPGIFSTRILSVFVTAFGGFGAVATYYDLSTVAASGVGFVSGTGFALIIFAFARFLYGQQASSEVRTTDLVGQSARVVIGIPADGVGQVRCRVGEELVDKIARARDGAAIAENTIVRIEELLGDTVVVRRV
jgi:membrane protein implicated in regulation of membrane protease activity